MHRQTRRVPTVTDTTGVSQMDPWKDDRCRDFIALNTIQRLRSYHSETALPVEPVNSIRAKNLLMLPKAEPDGITCDTDKGCAIDTARILFFGPAAFVSLTTQGRMTASPHIGCHSSSRASPPTDGEGKRRVKSTKDVSSAASDLAGTCQNDALSRENDQGSMLGGGVVSQNTTEEQREGCFDVIETESTPLKRPEAGDAAETPAPRPPEGISRLTASPVAENKRENGGVNDGDDVHGVVKFSCAIVDAIVSYYQSLLSRGVVLDRFNAKDLAFSWWVVGRNMDVAVLNHQTGPARRDALLILLRHFYYELLNGQLPKKTLPVDASPAHPSSLSPPSSSPVLRNATTENRVEVMNGDKSEMAMEEKGKPKEEGEKVKRKEQEANLSTSKAVEGARKGVRSRLDPTRMNPPDMSSRSRRQLQTEGSSTNTVKNKASNNAEGGEEGTLTVTEIAAKSAVVANQTKPPSRQQTRVKDTSVAGDTVATQNTATRTATEGKVSAPSRGGVDGERAPHAERPSRSARAAIIEEIWRPIRSTRRRLRPSEDSAGFIDAGATMEEKQTSSTLSLNSVTERIQRRMANDPIYAALLGSFLPNANVAKMKTEHNNHTANNRNDVWRSNCGMRSSLMQLLRYHHVESPAPKISREGMKRSLKTGDENQAAEQSKEDEREAVDVTTGESHATQQFSIVPPSDTAVKMEYDVGEATALLQQDVKVEAGVDGAATMPTVRAPRSFFALSYAQQCLLTWEASLLLYQQPPVAVKKKRVESSRDNEIKSETVRPRRYYDYWSCP